MLSFQERGASRGPQSVDFSPTGRVVTSTSCFEATRIYIDAARARSEQPTLYGFS